MNGKKYNYSLRFVLVPGIDADKRIDELVKFCKNSAIDDVIFFIAPEDFYRGHITKEEAKPFVDLILKAKARLAPLGITTSLNPWITLGHGDRGRKMNPAQNFDRMVAYGGMKGETIVCPLSKSWIEYYVDYLGYLIERVTPKTVWIEDDFRLHGHFSGGEDLGCFCDEHMKLYAKELGVSSLARETFAQGMMEKKEGYREAYVKVNGKVMEDVLRTIIDRLGDRGVCFALMTSFGIQYHFEGRVARRNFDILSKYQPTINRLGVAAYRQIGSQKYANIYTRMVAPSRAFINDDLTVYSEIENAPMTRYCKSASWTAYQMLMTSPLLLNGATFDIFEFNGNGVTDGKLFAKKLTRIKPFLEKILNTGVTYSQASGVEVAILRNRYMGYGAVPSLEALSQDDNFMGAILSMLGCSVKYSEDPLRGDIVALLPTTANLLSEEELEEVLSKKLVILSADAVEAIVARGLGSLLFIKKTEKMIERTAKYTYEQVAKKGIAEDDEARASCQMFVGHCMNVEYEEGKAEALTKTYNYDFSLVGNGITLVNGNILIFPYYDAKECWGGLGLPFGLLHGMRGAAIRYAILRADEKKQSMFSPNCMLLPHYFKGEEKDYVILTNYLEDEIEAPVLICKEEYKKIFVADVDKPTFRKVKYEREGDCYTLRYTVPPNEAVLVELHK